MSPKWRRDKDDDSMEDETDDRGDGVLITEELMIEIVEALAVPADSDEDREEVVDDCDEVREEVGDDNQRGSWR